MTATGPYVISKWRILLASRVGRRKATQSNGWLSASVFLCGPLGTGLTAGHGRRIAAGRGTAQTGRVATSFPDADWLSQSSKRVSPRIAFSSGTSVRSVSTAPK